MKKKLKLKLRLILILLIIAVISVAIVLGVKSFINKQEIKESIHGIVIADKVAFYKAPKENNVKQIKVLKKTENVYILEELEKDGILWYKVKVDGKTNGYVYADSVDYYKEEIGEKVLVSDVSQFNFDKNFKTKEEFEYFIITNKINGVYIRAGGRGYGTDGNFYEDKMYQEYIDACEYLKVPYGFYFLDEALDDKEINEEVTVIKEFLKKAASENCKLPLALDIEDHKGNGRADDKWEERAPIVQKLIDSLKKENIDTIIYANARNCKFIFERLRYKILDCILSRTYVNSRLLVF